ncbi:conserved Plasmodium protein, unknown function [Plasmodium ovale curtisi]|uniref:Uncharacterized protein n=1 Tax=Plasmodium ovale curtisi TaxID=864141 RepID=A0A1A8W015_PLAOA|nr:conserved Plasmodium protein, unknown function [Plasmodium ovale curtisi]
MERREKCNFRLKKKSGENENGRNKRYKKSDRKNVQIALFDDDCDSDSQEKDEIGDTSTRKVQRVDKIRSVKNGNILIEDERNVEDQGRDKVSQTFINNLKKKLSRLNSQKKIVYLNLPPNGSSNTAVRNTTSAAIDISHASSADSDDSDHFSDVEIKDMDSFIIRKDTTLGLNEERGEEGSLLKSDKILHKETEEIQTEMKNSKDGVGGADEGMNRRSNHDNENEKGKTSFILKDSDNSNENKQLTKTYIITEENLTFKRKALLDSVNKNETDNIFRRELNLYQDFKEHNVKIENYGSLILKKMGFNENIYNEYINKYYNYDECSDDNYFDKIYKHFSSREFRFTGIGAEGEMKENMEEIKGGEKGKKGYTERKQGEHMDEVSNSRSRGRNCERNRERNRERNCRRSDQYGEAIDVTDAEEEEKSHADNSSHFFEGLIVKINLKTHPFYKRKGIIIYKRGEENKMKKKKKKKRRRLIYGLLLFKNYKHLSVHKKIILDEMDKLRKRYEHDKEADSEKKAMGKRTCSSVSHSGTSSSSSSGSRSNSSSSSDSNSRRNCDEHDKRLWAPFLKRLRSKSYLGKNERMMRDNHEDEKKEEFNIVEIKKKYLETTVSDEYTKCKVVSKRICHPVKKMPLYGETVELKKIKSNYAFVQVRKKYILKVSLDDVCHHLSGV